jgi:hypothetical protein
MRVVEMKRPFEELRAEALSDDELTKYLTQAWGDFLKEARETEARAGMSVPEIIFHRCANSGGADYRKLPSPHGGVIGDHCPPGYRGFDAARHEVVNELVFCHLPRAGADYFAEAGSNGHPVPLPPGVALKVVRQAYIKSVELLARKPSCEAEEVSYEGGEVVRYLICEAMYWILLSWPGPLRPYYDLTPETPDQRRARKIDLVTDFKAYKEAKRMAEAEAIKEAAEIDKILEAEAAWKEYEAKKRRRGNG